MDKCGFMDGMKDLIKSFLGIMLVVAVSFLIGCRYGRKTAKNPVRLEVIKDTTEVIKYDTIVRERPVYRYSYIYDTVRTHFTTIEHDTVVVDLPLERRVYQEDSLYRAVVSGPRIGKAGPSLDSLLIFSKTTTITVHEKSPAECRPYSWTLFPQAEVNYGGGALEMKAGIGVDMAINENGRWRFIPEFGYRALQIDDRMLKGCYVGGKIKYNLIQVK